MIPHCVAFFHMNTKLVPIQKLLFCNNLTQVETETSEFTTTDKQLYLAHSKMHVFYTDTLFSRLSGYLNWVILNIKYYPVWNKIVSCFSIILSEIQYKISTKSVQAILSHCICTGHLDKQKNRDLSK
jgi:hypothetical protein